MKLKPPDICFKHFVIVNMARDFTTAYCTSDDEYDDDDVQ